jgi:ferredoxin
MATPAPSTTASVAYRSRGSLLLVGNTEQVVAALPLLPTGLKTLAVVSDGGAALEAMRSVWAIPGTVIQLTGHLGCYRASAAGGSAPLDLGPLSPNGDGLFDLVLDLYQTPLLSHEVPPLGYARTRGGTSGLAGKLEGLARLIGTVNKPRYFTFDEGICAHDRQGVPGCRRCLDACPALAITAGKDGIAIDPYLCRGCGSCTLVCPTGAVRYARPRPRTSLEQIAEAVAAQQVHPDATAPVLAIQVGEDLAGIPDGTPRLQVQALGSVGMELWLAALALGASRVLIVRSGLLPPTTARLIEEQVELTWRILKAIGEAPERVRLVNSPRDLDWDGLANPWPAADLNVLAKARDKRGLLLAALSHLARHLPERHMTVPLADDAPLGTIAIDAGRCTLCHACVQLCPTGALRRPGEALAFLESACVQCGLCVNGCPERALSAEPRFAPDLHRSGAEVVLKPASELFRCVECGTPFAPRSLVEGSIAHVRDHPMFQGDGLRLLQMCMPCRQKATLGLTGTAPSDLLNAKEASPR